MSHHLSATSMGLLAAMVAAIPAYADTKPTSPVVKINEEAAKADIKTVPVRGNISVLMGSGGNIGVLTGSDGKLMVDGGIALSKVKIAEALAALGNQPLKYVIDTHYHWDHTDSNAWLHEAGATILATPNTVKHLTAPETRVDDWDYTFKAVPAAGIPSETVTKTRTLKFDNQTVTIKPVAPAHTDSDLYVSFRPADVLFAGDLFWNGVYPFIDNEQGGNIDGMIRADDEILARVTDKTVIVPGHGPVATRAQLVEFRDMLVAIRRNVATLKRQGKSLADVVAAKPTAAYDAKFGKFVIGPELFTKIVYEGVK